jgi:hypothetical protein
LAHFQGVFGALERTASAALSRNYRCRTGEGGCFGSCARDGMTIMDANSKSKKSAPATDDKSAPLCASPGSVLSWLFTTDQIEAAVERHERDRAAMIENIPLATQVIQ